MKSRAFAKNMGKTWTPRGKSGTGGKFHPPSVIERKTIQVQISFPVTERNVYPPLAAPTATRVCATPFRAGSIVFQENNEIIYLKNYR
jgi:hypothetical protein